MVNAALTFLQQQWWQLACTDMVSSALGGFPPNLVNTLTRLSHS